MKLYIVYNYREKHPGLKGSLLTDALIRDCLGRDDLDIERTEKGKPLVRIAEGSSEDSVDGASDSGLHISVSHSLNTFALLVADVNVGLDIQYARDIGAMKIAGRYFTEEEAAYVEEGEQEDRFFRLWTRKEALSKYTGDGLEQILKKETVLGREDVIFMDFRLEDGCFCAVCAENDGGSETDEIQISY